MEAFWWTTIVPTEHIFPVTTYLPNKSQLVDNNNNFAGRIILYFWHQVAGRLEKRGPGVWDPCCMSVCVFIALGTIWLFLSPHGIRQWNNYNLCLYLDFLIQFIEAALRPYFLFRALWSRHITVKHTGSYDGTSISGFTSRKVHTSSTPQLKTQLKQSNTIRYIIASL